VTLILALALALSPVDWDPVKASRKLDERAAMWRAHERTRRSHDTNCISCHSGAPYLIARPSLRKLTGESGLSSTEKELLEDIALRVTKWSEVEPWYAHTEAKVRESRATEAILNAFVLSYREPEKGSELRKRALENLWAEQRVDGGFDWLHFDLAPWETDESDLFGSCLAAVAASIAEPETSESFERLAAYLRASASSSRNLHSRLGLLWAEASRPGLLPPERKKALLDEVLRAQKDDGGFLLSDLGPWKRKSAEADGYATGLAVYVLEELGDPAARTAVDRGISWLVSHQDPLGGWAAESANKDRSGDDPFIAGFMSDAASAFAVLALSSR
jgi:squalene-hopene/tetraprenyl-beta-curcumene cyclase